MIASGKRCDLLLCKVMESLEENFLKRLNEQFPDLPVVVWGARPIAVFREALRQGADDYLHSRSRETIWAKSCGVL